MEVTKLIIDQSVGHGARHDRVLYPIYQCLADYLYDQSHDLLHRCFLDDLYGYLVCLVHPAFLIFRADL